MAVTGSLTVGTTAAQLIATSTPFSYAVRLRAAPANSDNVYVGFSNAVTAGSADATDGYVLDAGQEVLIEAAMMRSSDLDLDADAIYVIGGAASQKVFFLAY